MTKEERLARERERFAAMRDFDRQAAAEFAAAGEAKAAEFAAASGPARVFAGGMDEAGRGPLAGPVVAACVVLGEDFEVMGVDDSKKLSAKKREELFAQITAKALAYGVGMADNNIIDEINILNATKLAMKRALKETEKMLGRPVDLLLIDAVRLDDANRAQQSIIKGDASSLAIAAASIIAKVTRDRLMIRYDEEYPGYGFAGHKGYGTAAHYDAIAKYGITPIHRKSFLKNVL